MSTVWQLEVKLVTSGNFLGKYGLFLGRDNEARQKIFDNNIYRELGEEKNFDDPIIVSNDEDTLVFIQNSLNNTSIVSLAHLKTPVNVECVTGETNLLKYQNIYGDYSPAFVIIEKTLAGENFFNDFIKEKGGFLRYHKNKKNVNSINLLIVLLSQLTDSYLINKIFSENDGIMQQIELVKKFSLTIFEETTTVFLPEETYSNLGAWEKNMFILYKNFLHTLCGQNDGDNITLFAEESMLAFFHFCKKNRVDSAKYLKYGYSELKFFDYTQKFPGNKDFFPFETLPEDLISKEFFEEEKNKNMDVLEEKVSLITSMMNRRSASPPFDTMFEYQAERVASQIVFGAFLMYLINYKHSDEAVDFKIFNSILGE